MLDSIEADSVSEAGLQQRMGMRNGLQHNGCKIRLLDSLILPPELIRRKGFDRSSHSPGAAPVQALA